jgi:hypothetical protein
MGRNSVTVLVFYRVLPFSLLKTPQFTQNIEEWLSLNQNCCSFTSHHVQHAVGAAQQALDCAGAAIVYLI